MKLTFAAVTALTLSLPALAFAMACEHGDRVKQTSTCAPGYVLDGATGKCLPTASS